MLRDAGRRSVTSQKTGTQSQPCENLNTRISLTYTWNTRSSNPESSSNALSCTNSTDASCGPSCLLLTANEATMECPWLLPPSSLEVKNAWNYTAISICAFMTSPKMYYAPSFRIYFLSLRWRWRSWLRHCATSRKVAGSIPDGLIGIFDWQNSSGRTMALA